MATQAQVMPTIIPPSHQGIVSPIGNYRANYKQRLFHASKAKYRLFGGAAGPGKSLALLMEAIMQAHLHQGVNTIVFRRTVPELKDSIIKYFLNKIPRESYKIYNSTDRVVYWHNGSTTKFGACQHKDDVTQFQSAEFLFIGIDELTHWTYDMWEYMTSRNRCPVPGSFSCMAGATNPGGIGHQWVKALWGCGGTRKKAAPGCDARQEAEYDPADYAFIPALLSDNEVYANDESYKKKLRMMRTSLYEALLNGDWSIFEGQFFENFSQSKHVRKHADIELKPWWPRWISGDWGYAHPACFHWHARADTGEVITYRELYDAEIGETEWARRIVEANGDEKIRAFFMGGDAESKRGEANTVFDIIGDIVTKAGIPHPEAADDHRINGARLMHQLIDSNNLVISTDCPNLIAQLPLLIHNADDQEDVLKVDKTEGQIGDDAYDSARYGYKSYLSPGNKPMEVKFREAFDAIPEQTRMDPTMVAFASRRIERELEHKMKPVRLMGHRLSRFRNRGRAA